MNNIQGAQTEQSDLPLIKQTKSIPKVIIVYHEKTCPRCGTNVKVEEQKIVKMNNNQGVQPEQSDLPLIKQTKGIPKIITVYHEGRCPRCGTHVKAKEEKIVMTENN